VFGSYQDYEVDSYFRMHRGCSVRLYQVWSLPPNIRKVQDTCCPTDLPHLAMVQGPGGTRPTLHSCWKDLYYDLQAAEHIITITGWSVWTELR
jgi:hypothetical protein